MRYIAIFKDGSVSLPYPDESKLTVCNDFRMGELHTVISSNSIEEEEVSIKRVLHSMRLSYSCACQECVVRTMDIN
jgi:hypothetical protein